jgi:hypothetical protein
MLVLLELLTTYHRMYIPKHWRALVGQRGVNSRKPDDLAAFDRAVAAAPMYANPKSGAIAGNGIRLHIPIVHIAYRDTIENLNRDNGLDSRYAQLATLVACREMDEEYDWVEHEKSSQKSLPRNIVEIVRNKQGTEGLE